MFPARFIPTCAWVAVANALANPAAFSGLAGLSQADERQPAADHPYSGSYPTDASFAQPNPLCIYRQIR